MVYHENIPVAPPVMTATRPWTEKRDVALRDILLVDGEKMEKKKKAKYRLQTTEYIARDLGH